MAHRTLVVAPHPDDEILGCGGTLLRRRAEGAELGWLIVTGISESAGWTKERVQQREAEIAEVARLVGFSYVCNLRLPTTRLDAMPMADLIVLLSDAFREFQPDEVLVPHCSDAHTDHRLVFHAVSACTKWFRYPSVRRVLAYETISETGFALDSGSAFHPNWFVDVADYLERKLKVMTVYQSEVAEFPFPRSLEAVRALAAMRGAASGFVAAEAFQLLRERQ